MVHFDHRERCFNTQPPEGGWIRSAEVFEQQLRFNTQPPEGGWNGSPVSLVRATLFQHTAARRRLGMELMTRMRGFDVSTHSRPKAAGAFRPSIGGEFDGFNTQPPEGGW